MGTLTYAGAGCHDPREVRAHAGLFFRRLREAQGGARPYLWVPEWHKSDHGLHLHFAVGGFIPRQHIERAWGRGFVHIKLLGDLPVGSTALHEARLAARYLGKYVGKAFDERRLPGLHRYERAKGFEPRRVWIEGRTRHDVLGQATALMGGPPAQVWSSDEVEDWAGPPAMWASWPG